MELVLEDRCDTTLGLRAHSIRALAETALVYEDDDPAPRSTRVTP